MSNNIILPSSEADRKAILDAMQEISNSYTRIEGERDYIKEAIAELSEKFSIPKPLLSELSRAMHNGDMDKKAGKFEDLTDLYESLVSVKKNEE